MNLTTADNFSLELKYISFQPTYISLLEGIADSSINKEIVSELKKDNSLKNNWYEHENHIILPKDYSYDEQLPEFMITVSLESSPIDSNFCGSCSNIIFFSNSVFSKTTIEILEPLVRVLHWKEISKDFDL